MQRLDVEYDINEIKRLLSIDSLKRNKNLEIVMRFLTNLENQLVLNLDDNWGTGKTVFLKQLEYLGNTDKLNGIVSNIDSEVMKLFQSKYKVFYFNAWEHDLYDNPLESLIYSLLMKIAEIEDGKKIQEQTVKIISKIVKKIGVLSADAMIKTITNGSVKLADFNLEDEDPIPEVTSIEMKREAIDELIEELLGNTNDKLLIIVDELDRCKPSYAVKLLEIVKHFFVNNQIVFLFGSNKKELAETVKHEYGQNFNGYKYLHRFFDFEFTLPSISKDSYIEERIGKIFSSDDIRWKEIIIVSDYFGFTMRDINRYISLIIAIKPYLDQRDNGFYSIEPTVKYLISFYMLGLRIHSGKEFEEFINGYGLDKLIDFYQTNIDAHDYIVKMGTVREGREDIDVPKKIMDIYEYIGTDYSQFNYNLNSEQRSFNQIFDVITMMSNI